MQLINKVFLLTLFLVGQSLFAQYSKAVGLPERGVCAHRGAMNTHPENTILAFNEAVRLGAQMIEFDVRMTKDGQLVIMHDESVDRTTNGSGLVSELTFDYIRSLDAGNWKSEKFKGEKTPTLREALQMMPQNIWLNIHLKGDYQLGKETAKVLVSENRLHQGVIACGSDAARGAKEVNENVIICNMERQSKREAYVQETIQQGFGFIQLLKKRTDDGLVNDIKLLKQKGVKINYFYGDNVSDVKELFSYGVDFVLTNNLSEIMDISEHIGIKRANE